MKRLLALSLLLIASSPAWAESVSFETYGLKSGYVPGVGRIHIYPAEQGKLRVLHDENTCSPDGMVCTKMAVMSRLVEPKVIEDRRPVDGNLLLQLTPEMKLSVGSGFNVEGMIHYTAIVTNSDGSKEVHVDLMPNVGMTVSK